MAKMKGHAVETSQTVQAAPPGTIGQPLTSTLPTVGVDGLPIPHRRAQWNHEEVIRFITVWNSSSSIQDVMKSMNRSLAACYSMAKQCRKNGVNLKSLGKSAGIDWNTVKAALPS